MKKECILAGHNHNIDITSIYIYLYNLVEILSHPSNSMVLPLHHHNLLIKKFSILIAPSYEREGTAG